MSIPCLMSRKSRILFSATSIYSVVDRVLSKSYIQVLPAEKKEQVAAQIRYFLSEAGDARLDWVDRSEGVFSKPDLALSNIMF